MEIIHIFRAKFRCLFSPYPFHIGLLQWLRRWRICLQCRRSGFDPWVGKMPWRRECLPTPVFLPGEFHGQKSLVVNSPWGLRVRHTWATFTVTYHTFTTRIDLFFFKCETRKINLAMYLYVLSRLCVYVCAHVCI